MPSRRATHLLLVVCAAAVLFALVYSYFIEPRRLVLNIQDLPVAKLDPAFDGLKIVAIGDIHGGSNYVTEERIREIVKLSNEQRPDIVVLLGDYVAHDIGSSAIKMPIETIADDLTGLEAKYGVFAVLGNHDGWYNNTTVARELSRVGITVLQNEVATIVVNGKSLRILGLKDHMSLGDRWYGDPGQAKQLVEKGDGQIIALEHSPDIFPYVTGERLISPDLRLMLAAHTHGGQVWLPVIGSPIVPSSYGNKYARGHIRESGVDMFVTTGIGTSILPLRFLVPPEIAVLTLKSDD